jgi:sporulation protein YlmC with PRC-barrel domain
MDDETTQHEETTATPIAGILTEGLHVYDANGAKVGVVRRYNLDAGYMVVEEGMLARKELYVPFHLIQSISPQELELIIPKEALTDAYLLPPEARPFVEEHQDASTGRAEMFIEHEIRSGYDGSLVEIAPVDVNELKRTLVVGMSVTDADDEYVGEVTYIDPAQETLVVKAVLVDDRIYQAPFSQIAQVDPDAMCVTLLVPKVAL